MSKKENMIELEGIGSFAVQEATLKQRGDVKQLFCENWNLIKTILEYVKDVIPGASIVIVIVLKLLEKLHKKICQ